MKIYHIEGFFFDPPSRKASMLLGSVGKGEACSHSAASEDEQRVAERPAALQ